MGEEESEEEFVDKVEEERRGILAKYEKGREDRSETDHWDDSTFEIYHATDHHGFIQYVYCVA